MKAKKRVAPKVTVYSTEYCPWCHKAKAFLSAHKVRFKSVDVGASEKAAREMIAVSGQTGVPVITVGKEVIAGFDESALRKALGMKKKGFSLW